MRTVLQRVSRACVTVEGEIVGAIDRPGLLALVAATHDDTATDVATTARKIAELRILPGETSVADSGAAVLVVASSRSTARAPRAAGRPGPGPRRDPWPSR